MPDKCVKPDTRIRLEAATNILSVNPQSSIGKVLTSSEDDGTRTRNHRIDSVSNDPVSLANTLFS